MEGREVSPIPNVNSDEEESHPLAQVSEGLLEKILVGWFLILFGLILIRNAWISDDAYITLRVVDNFLNGYGLRYNIDERVQVYTHPIWMFLLTGVYSFLREAYLTPLLLSFVTSLTAVWLVAFKFAASPLSALLALLSLILSQAFMDYSTSGLENPLTHLLSGLILLYYLKRQATFKSLCLLSLLTALATLNRMDTLLLFLPLLAYWLFQYRKLRGIMAVFLGFLPFISWEVFSLVYYGFPFPNTAYAKLGAGVSLPTQLLQGAFYYVDLIGNDPLTPLMICLVMLMPLRSHHLSPILCGVFLYLLYILKIGGDFMAGRFFSAPYYLAVAVLATFPLKTTMKPWALPFLVVVILGFTSSYPTVKLPQPSTSESDRTPPNAYISPKGISNEKLYYFAKSGLLNVPANFVIRSDYEVIRGKENSKVHVVRGLGFYGYEIGPKFHLVDVWALADPLLSRLPSINVERIGHYERKLPEGYYETLENGSNLIQNPDLARFYDAISLITRGELFTLERFKTIWKVNLGLMRPYSS